MIVRLRDEGVKYIYGYPGGALRCMFMTPLFEPEVEQAFGSSRASSSSIWPMHARHG
jgi:hypothetical protein